MPNIEDQFTAFRRGQQEVVFDFLGGDISSDGGVLLLRTAERKTNIAKDLAQLVSDNRNTLYVQYTYEYLLRQRVVLVAHASGR